MSADKICMDCGHLGMPAREKRGSAFMEAMVWTLLMLPGPFYSIWRRTGPRRACAVCKGTTLVPADSRLGTVYRHQRMLDLTDEPRPSAGQATALTPNAVSITQHAPPEIDPNNYRF